MALKDLFDLLVKRTSGFFFFFSPPPPHKASTSFSPIRSFSYLNVKWNWWPLVKKFWAGKLADIHRKAGLCSVFICKIRASNNYAVLWPSKALESGPNIGLKSCATGLSAQSVSRFKGQDEPPPATLCTCGTFTLLSKWLLLNLAWCFHRRHAADVLAFGTDNWESAIVRKGEPSS